MSLRFLIIEGNTREVREGYRAGQGVTPAEGYGNVMVGLAGDARYDILHAADADAALPAGTGFADYDAAIITGSALHLWQRAPEALRQVEAARAIYRAGIPFFGSCWGLQVAAVAAGGDVRRNPRGREVGFARKITRNAAGQAHPLLDGRPDVFDAPCSHLDEVAVPPPGAVILASNAVSPVQAAEFRFDGGTFWGVQYHPEYTLADLAFLIDRRMATLIEEGFFPDEAAKSTYVAELRRLAGQPAARDLCWRHGLGPDVTDPHLRVTELRNFIESRVKPFAFAREAA
ncbi:MAG: type 1 glutamine amidotransferase [Rhabdaerophilum sp.]